MPEALTEATRHPSRGELFLGFLQIGCLAFGGAQAWSRRVMVENRRWLTEREYAELLGLAQVLPGPNIGNLSVMLGRRLHGLAGSCVAVAGFFGLPLLLLVGLVTLYQRFGSAPGVDAFMHGTAAAAAGMAIGTGLRMTTRLRPPPEQIALGLAVCAAAAWARWPLPLIVLVAGPAGIALSLRRAWRAAV